MSEKEFPFGQQTERSPHTSPESGLVEKFPQRYVDNLFSDAAKKKPAEFSNAATIDEIKKYLDFIKNHREATLKDLDPSISNKFEEIIKLLENRTRGIDSITFLPNRDLFNETIKKTIIEIILAETEEKKLWLMRHYGIIGFDVRGLKVVNDSNKDHAVGDAFLRRIAKETSHSSKAQKNLELSLFRIGGDEFGITVFSSDHDLQAPTTEEELSNFFPTEIEIDFTTPLPHEDPEKPEKTLPPEHKQTFRVAEMACAVFRELQKQNPGQEVRFISVVGKLTQALLEKRTCEDIISASVIKRHLKKGIPDYTNSALENFKMPLLVASGETTFYEVFRNAKSEYIKRGERLDGLTADKIVTMLMSMVLLCADQESNTEKERQNARWTNSRNPQEQLYADLISRNSVTISLSQRLRRLTQESEDFVRQFIDLKKENETLKTERDSLAKRYHTLITGDFERGSKIEDLEKENKAREAEITTLLEEITRLEDEIQKKDTIIQNQEKTISEQLETITDLAKKIKELNT